MNIFGRNFNQNLSTHLANLGKIFSCKSDCKVDDFFEDKENKKPTTNQKNFCNNHIKPLSYYCRQCKLFLCVLCCSQHLNKKGSHHEFIELQNMDSFVAKEIDKLVKESLSIRNKLNSEEVFQNLPDYQKDFEQGLALLDSMKKDCIALIENHFNSLSEDYLNLFKSLPCKFQKDALDLALSEFIEKIQGMEAKQQETNTQYSKKKIKNVYDIIPDIRRFNELKLENELEILKKSMTVLIGFQPQSSKKVIQPKINSKHLKNLEEFLVDWVSLIGPTENPYDQFKKIRVSVPNYFEPQYENYLARADTFNEQLLLYNISSETEEKVCLTTESEIPQNHTLIITPNLDIFIVGGEYKDGRISKDLLFCSPMNSHPEYEGADLPLTQKAPMLTERIDHATCLVGNSLFCIGGRNASKSRMKCCEKYILPEDKWESIAPMNLERANHGVCTFNNSLVLAFWGAEEDDTFEKYDIQRDHWELIRPINSFPCFMASKLGSLQINPNQILIVGGTQEKASPETDKKEIEGLQRGILYNVNENNVINLGNVFGVPLIEPSQMIISENRIYCLGRNEGNAKERFTLKEQFEWVFRMKNGRGFEAIASLEYNKGG